ncbi:MAG: hypothetical protein WD939_01005 [Dehalococcoidia bacterium]
MGTRRDRCRWCQAAASRAAYRGRQLFSSLRPRVDPSARDEALAVLGERERALFTRMALRDQQHCLAVYAKLRSQGHDDRDLLAAALLHDAGKGRISLWHRVAFVMLETSSSRLLDVLASADGPAWPEVGGWRQALYRCRHHPALGAKLAEEAGASARTVALIREDPSSEGLAALHSADEGA